MPSKKVSKKASKKMSKKQMSKKSSKKAASKKTTKKGSKKTQKGGAKTMPPGMKAFMDLKAKVAKALGIPNGVLPAMVYKTVNDKLKDKHPDAVERAKIIWEEIEADIPKFKKIAEGLQKKK